MNRSSTESTRSEDHFAETIWNLGEKLGILIWHGLIYFFNRFIAKPLEMSLRLIIGYFVIRWIAYNGYHLKFLAWVWPSLFSGKFLDWIYDFGASGNFKFLLYNSAIFYVVVLGAIALRQKRKLKEKFEAIGLVNKFGEVPILIKHFKSF